MSTIETAAPLLKVREAADLLRVSRATAYRLIDTGELPAVRVGHSLRVPPDVLRDYIARGGGERA